MAASQDLACVGWAFLFFWAGGDVWNRKAHELLFAHGEGGRRTTSSSGGAAVGSRRLLAGTAFPASVLGAEGMGRERKVRGFYFGDSGHGKRRLTMAAAAAMAMASRSSWGALLGQREGLPRVGAGRGRRGGAHLERNRTKIA